MHISGHFAGTLLNNTLALYNNATLTIYSGTPGEVPATVETAPTGVVLSTWQLADPAFPTLSFPATIIPYPTVPIPVVSIVSNNFPSPNQNPVTGTAGYARVFVWQWAAGIIAAANSYAFNAGNLYYTVAGGTTGSSAPTVTSGAVSDGTVTWVFVQTANNGSVGHAISDHTVNTTAADVIVGTTAFENGTVCTLNTLTINMPVA